jgi:hypothetical protein
MIAIITARLSMPRRLGVPSFSAWLACAGAFTAAAVSTASPEKGSAPVIREVQDQGYQVRLDLASQVLRLSIPERRVYGSNSETTEESLHPTFGDLLDGRFVSASMLVQKAKQFDDGLYAAVELATQNGAGRFPGKAAFLALLTRSLSHGEGESPSDVLSLLLGAGQLGRLPVEVPKSLKGAVDAKVAQFLGEETASKPIGFYTWTPELEAIFRQDRMLQSELTGAAGIGAVVEALHADRELRSTYEAYLALVSRLTNPPAKPDLRPLLASRDKGAVKSPAKGVFFFPPSVSRETELIKKLYGDRYIPEGFSLIDEMIRRIRNGDLNLTPSDDSGWYDYQTWAQEPLVIPDKMAEDAHLSFDQTYREALLGLFKGAQALARETHVKQLERPEVMAMPRPTPAKQATIIGIRPDLAAEPTATFYLRRAQGYRFVRKAVETALGPGALKSLHRMTPEGPAPSDLDRELAEMEGLLNGASATVGRQIGMPRGTSPSVESGADADTARFAKWAAAVKTDPDLGRDVRMMVPVFFDRQRHKTKVWVLLGWVSRDLRVEFVRRPAAEVFDPAGNPVAEGQISLAFLDEFHRLVYPVTAEVYVTRILNRDEFRRHCDMYKTRSAILANLR